jgi:Zn-dependent metalloprotease
LFVHDQWRSPINCIVPEHILRGLATAAPTQAQRDSAINALALDTSIRSARLGQAELLRPVRAARRAARLLEIEPLWLQALEGQLDRTVFDAGSTQRLPGAVVRSEGDGSTGDPAVDEAYAGLGDTFNLYSDVYGRNSIDDDGFPLNATVHFGVNYDNAFWDGRRMIFGDGDGVTFRRFTRSLDVIGHELTHGVTEHEAGLIYWGQPGALNEAISDVFGSCVKQYKNDEKAADADWLIGAELLAPGVNGEAIRSLKAPGTAYNDPVLGGRDPQPAHMDDYVRGLADNGGVHINSGIPNHAFYLLATAIGGNAWEEAGMIWYATLTHPALRRTSQFQAFAALTVTVARQLFGVTSPEQQAVRQSWAAVGISV